VQSLFFKLLQLAKGISHPVPPLLCITHSCPNTLLTIVSLAFSSSAVTLAIPAAFFLAKLTALSLAFTFPKKGGFNAHASALQVVFPPKASVMLAYSQNKVQEKVLRYFQHLSGTESAPIDLFLRHLKNISDY